MEMESDIRITPKLTSPSFNPQAEAEVIFMSVNWVNDTCPSPSQ